MLGIYTEFFTKAAIQHMTEKVEGKADQEARILLQMMTKAINLQMVLNGLEFKSREGHNLKGIIDHTIVGALARNIYETTGLFNAIYRNTNSKDEKDIVYNLWVHAGLANRQRFEPMTSHKDNLKKLHEEKRKQQETILKIKNNELFTDHLDEKSQTVILDRLKKKEFLIQFIDGEVKPLTWTGLISSMKVKEGNNLFYVYPLLSLYAHPSYVSVFQFATYSNENPSYMNMVITLTNIALSMFSIFCADYLHAFPSIMASFERMETFEQIAISYPSGLFRGEEYHINDAWKELG